MKCPKCGAKLERENKADKGRYYTELQCVACDYRKVIDEVSDEQLEEEMQELN